MMAKAKNSKPVNAQLIFSSCWMPYKAFRIRLTIMFTNVTVKRALVSKISVYFVLSKK